MSTRWTAAQTKDLKNVKVKDKSLLDRCGNSMRTNEWISSLIASGERIIGWINGGMGRVIDRLGIRGEQMMNIGSRSVLNKMKAN